MPNTLNKKVNNFLLLITFLMFSSVVQAGTTFGQEEDTFSQLWAHHFNDGNKVKKPLVTEQKSSPKGNEHTFMVPSGTCSPEDSLRPYQETLGARLY